MRNKLLILTCAVITLIALNMERGHAQERRFIRIAQTPRVVVQAAPASPKAQTELAEKIRREVTSAFAANPFFVHYGDRDSLRVDLDLDNVPVQEAIRKVMEQAKRPVALDPDVPKEPRITVKARGVRLGTALDLITDAAGIGWAVESRGGQTTYRFGKNLPTHRLSASWSANLPHELMKNALGTTRGMMARIAPDGFVYSLDIQSERSTFNCPHCKAQSTVIRSRQQPKCTKCERTFERDWQFCPADGSKRPAAPVEWKYCPSCGKEVRMQKSEGDMAPMVLDPEEAQPVAREAVDPEGPAQARVDDRVEEEFYLLRQ